MGEAYRAEVGVAERWLLVSTKGTFDGGLEVDCNGVATEKMGREAPVDVTAGTSEPGRDDIGEA